MHVPDDGEGSSFKAGFLGTKSRMDSSLIPPGEAIAVGMGPPSELSKIVLQLLYHMDNHATLQYLG